MIMAAKWLTTCSFFVVLLVSYLIYVSPKKYNPVNTYFRRVHPNGSLVDQHNPSTRLNFNFRSIQQAHYTDPNVVLKATPSVVANGGNVTLSWAGVKLPNSGDAIVFFCPADANPDHYLDYYHVSSSPTWDKGFGDFQLLKVFNMRSNCEFRYYWRAPNGTTIQLATSNLISFEGGPNKPLQGHIALTGNPTEMRVMWVSGTNETPVAYYGTNESVTMKVMGTTRTYTAKDMCAPTANTTGFFDAGYIHDVLLIDLKPSTVYYYKFGSSEILSPLRHFKSAPIPGPEVAFKFITYGDMGVESPATGAYDIAKYVMREVQQGNATQVFHIGDISYAMGYAYIWDQWHALIEPYATLVPYMVGVGNHEQDHEHGGERDPSGAPGEGFHPWWGGFGTDSNGECGVPMFYRFHMPDNGNAVFWYSYNYGSVHFIMMSSEHDYMKGSRQHTWLENDLKNVDRSVTPWVIIGGHRPMYTSQAILIDYFVSQGMKHGFEDLLMKYKVDLALWAHYHSYERTCAVYNEKCTEGAPTHIVVGTAGRSFDGEDYWPKIWSMYREINYGYGRVTVANSSALHWEWIRNKDDVVADHVWIYKNSQGAQPEKQGVVV